MSPITREFVQEWARKYSGFVPRKDLEVESRLKPEIKNASFLSLKQFVEIGVWKASQRIKPRLLKNSEDTVREKTQKSFATTDEKSKIGILTQLHGVGYPVASAILHFRFPDKYPIWDRLVVRSLNHCGYDVVPAPDKYSKRAFPAWTRFCEVFLALSNKLEVPIRELDKALWAYSKESVRCRKLAARKH